MKNRLRDMLQQLTARKDGYDPDGKTVDDGKEREARRAIRDRVLSDPIGETTRRAKRSLLIFSVLVLVINARLPIEKIPYLESLPSVQSTAAILGLLSVGLVYLLVVFLVSAGLELLRWRHVGTSTALVKISDWLQNINENCRRVVSNQERLVDQPNDPKYLKLINEETNKLPAINKRVERTLAHYDSTSRIQLWRMIVLDLALPLLIAAIALLKVAALVLPMIVQILSA